MIDANAAPLFFLSYAHSGQDVPTAHELQVARFFKATHMRGEDAAATRGMLLTRIQRGDQAAESERDRVIDGLGRLLGSDHHSVVTLRGERRLMRVLDPQPF